MGKYFSIAELTKSATAENKNIDNTPNKEVEKNLN
jgi:zinc D-Ala-D-Ala carboxypeptidase